MANPERDVSENRIETELKSRDGVARVDNAALSNRTEGLIPFVGWYIEYDNAPAPCPIIQALAQYRIICFASIFIEMS